MAEKVSREGVAYLAPESIQREERERIIKSHKGDNDKLIEKLDSVADLPGEYRQVEKVQEGATEDVEYGEKLVCVGEDEYEVYDSKAHGEPYSPLAQELRGAPQEVEKNG